jgi:class 3 adenylate cyclase
MSTPIKRKLAAILAADVAGYSRLMAGDEEGTLRILAAHRAVVDSIIELHDGRVVNTAGDSVLAEFTSPVEAVRAAIEIQDALKTRNESLPEPRRMVFRIGVNLGDVMIKGDDLLGDGVNVAARLQTLAEPGGICISSSIHDQIEGKLSLQFQDIGEQTLKNIARPVRAFQLRGRAPLPPAAPPRTRPVTPRRRSMLAAISVAVVVGLGATTYLAGLLPGLASRESGNERAAWEAVKDSTDAAALERFVSQYPGSPHAPEARAKAAGLVAGARQATEAERLAAERARAEAEVERLRVEAEAARRQLAAETARQKADAERAVAGERAKAQADLDRLRAEAQARERAAAQAQAAAEAEAAREKAEAELARARAEAEGAQRRAEGARLQAESERRKAEEERAAAAKARAEAEAARAAAGSTRAGGEGGGPSAAVAPPVAPKAVPPSRESRFDGTWTGNMTCLSWRDFPPLFVAQRVTISNGNLILDAGKQGQPASWRVTGALREDDTIELRGAGINSRGQPYEQVIKGQFSGVTFTGQTFGPVRPCSFKLTRAGS